MNPKLLSVMMLFFVLLTVGCTDNSDKKENSNNEIEANQSIPSPSSTPAAQGFVPDLKLEGDIKNIYYAKRDKVLITADKLYLYDSETGSVLKEATKEAFDRENYWVIDGGYVAVGESFNRGNHGSMMAEGGFSYSVIFYDHDLNTVSEFDLDSLLEDDDMLLSLNSISFSSDGSQVTYATFSGLYLYDFTQSKKFTVIDLESEDFEGRNGIVNLEQVGFTHDDQRIAFKAQSFAIPVDPNKPSFDTCGIVNVDGTGLLNKTFDNYTCKELTSYTNHLLLAEDPTMATGRTLVMEVSGDNTRMHKLVEKKESGNVWGSNEGSYFATSISNKTDWTIRVYNMDTGKLEMEQLISIDGENRYMEQDPVIKVIDDTRTYIVLLGSKQNEVETKMIVNQF